MRPESPPKEGFLDAPRQLLRQVPFLICCGLLLATALLLQATVQAKGWRVLKDPLPLRQLLSDPPKILGPFELVEVVELPEEIIESLGTKDYVQATYRDTRMPEDRPAAFVQLFVTYYTGIPDSVPHVPERCYTGGGHTKIKEGPVAVEVKNLPDNPQGKVDVKAVTFERIANGMVINTTPSYYFACNGTRTLSPLKVRTILKNPTDKYCYYAKIEVNFSAVHDREKSIAKAKEFLQYAAPVMENEYLPDWAAATANVQDNKKATPTNTVK